MRYKLAPYVSLGVSNQALKIGFGSIQVSIVDPSYYEPLIDLSEHLLEWRTLDDIENFLRTHPSCMTLDVSEIISIFQRNNFLLSEGIYDREDRYSRNHLFYNMRGNNPIEIQDKLKNSHVVILGCGGIGNLVSANLATAGVGRLTLIDNDKIEISNLSRQILFTESDIGRSKTEALSEALRARNHSIRIDTLDMKLEEDKDFYNMPSCNLIVLSGDSWGICHKLNKYCYSTKQPFIHSCYILDIAVCGPLFIPGKTPCFECFAYSNISNKESKHKEWKEKIKHINSYFQSPSIGPVNMLSASMASLEAINFLGGLGPIACLNKRIGLWTNDYRLQFQEFDYRRDCAVCKLSTTETNTEIIKHANYEF